MNEKETENRKHAAEMRLVSLSRLKNEIEKLNRRARKLGLPELTVEETGRYQCEIRKEIAPDTWIDTGLKETWVKVVVIGESPKLEGWEFLGTLDHTAGDTIVRNAPGCEIPETYWTGDRVGLCDHCGTKRRRKETFVVRRIETGETKQVGRQCVVDFLGGKSVEAATSLASWVRRVGDVLDDDYGYEYGGNMWREPILIDSDKALAISVRVVNEYGYISRVNAEEQCCQSTADRVREILWPPLRPHMPESERKAICEEIERCTPKNGDVEKTVEMKKWIAECDVSGSSYAFNLQAIVKRELVQPKEIGFLASLVPFYFREIENPEYEKKERVPSEHIG